MNSEHVFQEENIIWTVIGTIASFEMNRTDLTFLIKNKKNNNKNPTDKQTKPGARVVT